MSARDVCQCPPRDHCRDGLCGSLWSQRLSLRGRRACMRWELCTCTRQKYALHLPTLARYTVRKRHWNWFRHPPETRVTFDAFDVIPAIQTTRASLHDYCIRSHLSSLDNNVPTSGSNSDKHQTRRLIPIRPDERVDSHNVVSTCSFSAWSRPTSSPIPESEPRTRPTYDVGPFLTHAPRPSSLVPKHRQARIHPQ